MPSRETIASGRTAVTGFLSSGFGARDRNATLELMSGSTRASFSTNFTLTRSVALVRSTVGTTRETSPSRRTSGYASSWISVGMPTFTLESDASETSASTSSVSMSAMLTTAPLESVADENGVMMSPTLAFLVSTMPSKGARMRVCSTETPAWRALASATPMAAFSDDTAALAFSARARAVSSVDSEMNFFA